jgi:hypothetical protein
MLDGIYETHIPILDQHQKRSCGRSGFFAAGMHWILVAWNEGIVRHHVCF